MTTFGTTVILLLALLVIGVSMCVNRLGEIANRLRRVYPLTQRERDRATDEESLDIAQTMVRDVKRSQKRP